VVLIGLENGFLEETRFLDFKTKKRFAHKLYKIELQPLTDYCLLITERFPISTRKLIFHDYL